MYQIQILSPSSCIILAEIKIVKTHEMRLTLNFVKVCFKNISLYAILYRSLIIICVVEVTDPFSNPTSFPICAVLKFNECVPLYTCGLLGWSHFLILLSLIPDKAQFYLTVSISAVCSLIWVMSPNQISSSYFPLFLTKYKMLWFIITFP